jgi:hypothetical protein
MIALVAAISAAAVVFVTPPLQTQPGTRLTNEPWKELSHATSPRTHRAAFTRGFLETPTAFAFTVSASTRGAVRLFWSMYCEGFENDTYFNQQGTLTMRAPFGGYPPSMPNASKCVLTLRATPTSKFRAYVTTFGY